MEISLFNEDDLFEWIIYRLTENKLDQKDTLSNWLMSLTTQYLSEKMKISVEFELFSSPSSNIQHEKKTYLKGNPRDKTKLYMMVFGGIYFDSIIGKEGNQLNLPYFTESGWEKKITYLNNLIEDFLKLSEKTKLLNDVVHGWKNKAELLVNEKPNIVFVGESRIGKSTLINTILGVRDFLPTSPDSACTAGSIHLKYSDKLKMSFEFFTEDEMKKTVKSLLEERENIKEEKKIKAEDSLKSIFGKKANMDTLKGEKEEFPEEIIKIWDKHNSLLKLDDLKDRIDKMKEFIGKYMSSAATDKFQYWPFVKTCQVFVNFNLLKFVDLIDLPGLHDFNPLREKAARNVIEKSNFLILVSRYSNLTTTPDVNKIIRKDIIERGIHACVIGSLLDTISIQNVKDQNNCTKTLSDDQVILYEREKTNYLFLEKYSGYITEVKYKEFKTFYNQAKLVSMPFFGVSSEGYNEMNQDHITKFKNINQTGILDFKLWIENHFIQKEIDFRNLVDEMFHCETKKILTDINISNHEAQASNFLKEKLEEYLKKTFDSFDTNAMECSDKSEDVIDKTRRTIKWNTFRLLVKNNGNSKKVNLNEKFIGDIDTPYRQNIPSFFETLIKFLEKDLIKEISKFKEIGSYKNVLINLKKSMKESIENFRKKCPDLILQNFENEMSDIYNILKEFKSQPGYFDKITSQFKILFIESNLNKTIYLDCIDKVKRLYYNELSHSLNQNLKSCFTEIKQKDDLSKEVNDTKQLEKILKILNEKKTKEYLNYLK